MYILQTKRILLGRQDTEEIYSQWSIADKDEEHNAVLTLYLVTGDRELARFLIIFDYLRDQCESSDCDADRIGFSSWMCADLQHITNTKCWLRTQSWFTLNV